MTTVNPYRTYKCRNSEGGKAEEDLKNIVLEKKPKNCSKLKTNSTFLYHDPLIYLALLEGRMLGTWLTAAIAYLSTSCDPVLQGSVQKSVIARSGDSL